MNKRCNITFNGFEPNINELSEIITARAGYRPLHTATPSDFTVGTVVEMFDTEKHYFFTAVIISVNEKTFSYTNSGNLDDDNLYVEQFYSNSHSNKNLVFRILLRLPVKHGKIQSKKMLSDVGIAAGFKPLSSATPSDLSEGSVAVLYNCNNHSFRTVIVRTLSMENKRFLYLRQSIVVGDWESDVLMDHLDSWDNYRYLVIS